MQHRRVHVDAVSLFNGGGMTESALITMLSTWTLITFYTVKFFVKVLRTPQHKDDAVKKST
jgi:hypothetical protein